MNPRFPFELKISTNYRLHRQFRISPHYNRARRRTLRGTRLETPNIFHYPNGPCLGENIPLETTRVYMNVAVPADSGADGVFDTLESHLGFLICNYKQLITPGGVVVHAHRFYSYRRVRSRSRTAHRAPREKKAAGSRHSAEDTSDSSGTPAVFARALRRTS